MDRILRGIMKYRQTDRKKMVEQFEIVKNRPEPKAVFFTCMDSRMIPTRFTETNVGDMFVVRNAGNIIPHSQHFVDEATTNEPAALELGCVVNDIRHIIVCGHSDCKTVDFYVVGLVQLYSHQIGNFQNFKVLESKTANDFSVRSSTLEINLVGPGYQLPLHLLVGRKPDFVNQKMEWESTSRADNIKINSLDKLMMAMNLLYALQCEEFSSQKNRRISPLRAWLSAHASSSLSKFQQLEMTGFDKPLVFHAETQMRKFVAYIDPEDKFCIADKLSQVNCLQQLQNIASYGFLKKRLEKHQLHIHALWFDIYTGDIYYFSRQNKRFVDVNEVTINMLEKEVLKYYS